MKGTIGITLHMYWSLLMRNAWLQNTFTIIFLKGKFEFVWMHYSKFSLCILRYMQCPLKWKKKKKMYLNGSDFHYNNHTVKVYVHKYAFTVLHKDDLRHIKHRHT